MDIRKRFGERLKELRISSGMSQTQLAKELGVSRVTISYYENSERTADIEFLTNAASLFNCTSDYLLGASTVKNESDAKQYGENLDALKSKTDLLTPEKRNDVYSAYISLAHSMTAFTEPPLSAEYADSAMRAVTYTAAYGAMMANLQRLKESGEKLRDNSAFNDETKFYHDYARCFSRIRSIYLETVIRVMPESHLNKSLTVDEIIEFIRGLGE